MKAEHDRPQRMAVPVPEVLEALAISRPTFYKIVAAGELQSFTIGRRRYVRFSDIEILHGPTAQGQRG